MIVCMSKGSVVTHKVMGFMYVKSKGDYCDYCKHRNFSYLKILAIVATSKY